MNEHRIFYYPYGSFRDSQAPFLKAIALYFDKLYILDPEKANSEHIGAGAVAQDVKMLEDEGILERIAPEEILQKYEHQIAAAIRADMQDSAFSELCERSGRGLFWTVALAKIPKEVRESPEFKPLDRSMQRLMGEVAQEAASNLHDSLAHYVEGYAEGYEELGLGSVWSGSVFDEMGYDESGNRQIEYRYADYPLPLGESIMMNHALFAGILYSEATPVTDDEFHSTMLNHKIERALDYPEIRKVVEDRKAAAGVLAVQVLTDTQLNLPILSPELPLETILEYRHDNKDDLEKTRERLGWLSRRIREEIWTKDYLEEIEHSTIPDIAEELAGARDMREKWLKSSRGRSLLSAAGIAVGTASTVLSLMLSPAPSLPIGIATAALSMTSAAALPGAEWILDWRDGKSTVQKNGLHYLVNIPTSKN